MSVSLVEDLVSAFGMTRRAEPVRKLPVCKSKGGLQPRLDLDNTAELLNILDHD
jgi:hypothetical protein